MESLFLLKVIYFFILAFILALLEIQIEGADGWAAKLPAWRAKAGGRLDRVTKMIFAGKDFTGYHFFLNLFLLLFIHWPFVWSGSWTIWAELEILAIYLLFINVWDFLWFVLNPKFSLRDFNKHRVGWHKKWLGKLPVDYYAGILLATLFLLPELFLLNPIIGLYKIIVLFTVNLLLLTITILIYPKTY